MEKIIIDTDLEDDIDDVLAIAFALHSPELDVVGITTVFRNTVKRARIAQKLLQVMNRTDIPVYAGCSNPLHTSVDPSDSPNQYTQDLDTICVDNDLHGVDYIISKVLAHPGEITLAAIGPLTNVAAAIRKEPRIRNCLKRIVLMGGSYTYHTNEYNTKNDPEASRIVFSSGIPILAVGFDVTNDCRLSQEQYAALKADTTPLGCYIRELTERWYQCWGHQLNTVILHDPLAIFAVFDTELIQSVPARVQVETRGEFTRGTTFAEYDYWHYCFQTDDNNTKIARSVDHKRFTELFMQRLYPSQA